MFSRRQFLRAGAAFGLGALAARPADALEFTPMPGGGDQSGALSDALWQAAAEGRALWLPPGRYPVGGLSLPDRAALVGAPGAVLVATGPGPVLTGEGLEGLRLSGLTIEGPGGAGADRAPDPAHVPEPDPDAPPSPGLLELSGCRDVVIERCTFAEAPGHAIALWTSGGVIRGNRFRRCRGAALSALEGTGLTVEANDIGDCADLGIYVAREEAGRDATVIRANRIAGIGWASGGNGQFGNGINLFRAGAVVVSDNVIDDCAFSAIRLNATRNAVVSGNICTRSGEVAIFSEFGFSGSVIADNVIDDAAQGIAITNMDEGGHLATCAGNIVRNIRGRSRTNPDTTPVGISAEAESALTGNVVENVPGVGIALGWGPYLRNVSASGNVLSGCGIGIGVSVVDGTGAAVLTGNVVARPEDGLGIAGMEWDRVVAPDLQEAAGRYPGLVLSGNRVVAAG